MQMMTHHLPDLFASFVFSSQDLPGNTVNTHQAAHVALENNDDDKATVEDAKPTAPTRFTLGHKQMSMKKSVGIIDTTDMGGDSFPR